MIKNIVFDLDGTLLDTIRDIARALNETLIKYKLAPITVEETTSFIGNGSDLLINRALKGVTLSPDVYQQFKQYYLDLQLGYQLANTEPFPGVMTMVRHLKQSGIRLFVFSNKPHDFATRLIDERFPNLFTATLGQKPGFAPKPDLTQYNLLTKEHDIDPKLSLFVGDSVVDIETAKTIGMPVVAVSWGYVGRKKLIDAKPDFLADSPRQLRDIVLAINRQKV